MHVRNICGDSLRRIRSSNRLFEQVDADTRFVRALPGQVPGSLLFNFREGHLLVPRPCVQRHAIPVVPMGVFDDFDAVIVNPGSGPARRAVLEALRAARRRCQRAAPVAITMRSDWDEQDLAAVKGEPSWWLFAKEQEAMSIATTLPICGRQVTTVEAALDRLKALIGPTRLLVTAGARGAYLFNGKLVQLATRAVQAASVMSRN